MNNIKLFIAWRKHKGETKLFINEQPLWLRNNSSDLVVFKDIFIDKEFDFQYQLEAGIIIDAGANIGLASIYLSLKYPEKKIYAIEPDKSNFELLEKNCKAYANIEKINAAISNSDGFSYVELTNDYWAIRTSKSGDEERRVKAFTINGLIKEFDIKRIALLKVDIEGGEAELLEEKSSNEWLSVTTSILIEIHNNLIDGISNSFVEFLSETNRAFELYPTKEKFLIIFKS
ncbi:MAG: FkbM family methyltransferase [Fulvivirga sp.]|uniref:FkbM family methyltransferase n=1 Tax=Fulvivirga sp. TaxID=1931237 RepID=UPI0032EF089E